MPRGLAYFFGSLLAVFITADAAGQYLGGDADGAAFNSLTQSACPALETDSNFFGGDGDGFSTQNLTQSVCPPQATDSNFFGGDGDGFSTQNLTQSVCPPQATDSNFFGGDGDGFSTQGLTQSVCPPLVIDSNYFGSDGDGFSTQGLTQSVCPPLEIDSNYFGSDGDGFSTQGLIQSVCPPLPTDTNFLGGNGDGFALNVLQQCDPLPIELLAFTALCERTRVVLKWSTATELGNDFFTLYRSSDGVEFQVVGTVPGAGNSNRVRHYAFTDEQPRPGISYYRLRQTDFDGKFEDAQVVAVTCSAPEADVLVYPNPATDEVTLEAEFSGGGMSVEVINSGGIVVYKGKVNQKATLQIAHLAPGLYLLKIERDEPGVEGSLPILKKLIKK